MKRLIRKCFKNSGVLLILLVIILFYTEIASYYLNTHNWYQIKCNEEKLCTKLILVADPQLIGKQNEILHFLTPLNIWDSDRYLHLTYKQVFNFVKPDIVIFLGDLFDEGSISSKLEFETYVERLHNVFNIQTNSSVHYIWLPGDNDIGGEGMDFVTSKKAEKFNRAFPQPDTVQYNNITFYRINKIVHYIPEIIDNNLFFDVDNIRVVLSHIPIFTSTYSEFADKILQKVQPHLLFTAHEHKFKNIKYHFKDKYNKEIITSTSKIHKKFDYTLGVDYVYEFLVPTCSYRMGTANMGYGFAVIEKDNLQYTTLWSPPRFSVLFFYSLLLTLTICILLLKLCARVLCKRRNVK